MPAKGGFNEYYFFFHFFIVFFHYCCLRDFILSERLSGIWRA